MMGVSESNYRPDGAGIRAGGLRAAFLRGWAKSRQSARRRPRSERSLVFRAVQAGDDLELLLDLVETGHKESRFGYIPFSRDKARQIGKRALAEGDRHLLIVAELRGRPVGFLFASAGEFHIGTGTLLTTIHAVYTEPAIRSSLLGGRVGIAMFRAVERWSRGIGAREIMLHGTSGIQSVRSQSAFNRIGLRGVGVHHVLDLET